MSSHKDYKERLNKIKERNAQKEDNRKREARVKELQKKRALIQSQADRLYDQYEEQNNAVKTISKAIAVETDPAVKETLKDNRAITANARDQIYDKWKIQDNRSKEITTKINALKKKKSSSKSTSSPSSSSSKPAGPSVQSNGGKVKFPYRYNAPLIRNAYFNPTSITSTSLDKLTINYSAYNTARDAWKNAKPAKGAVQMDKEIVKDQLKGLAKDTPNTKIDPQLYGFRFLYNPKEVTMGWATQAQVDPQFIPQDEALPVSTGLTAASVDFTLVLNRIEDMNYLNENGLTSQSLKRTQLESGPLVDVDPAQRVARQQAGFASAFPYPDAVAIEDMKDIYKKGTMHDLEYLFKVLHGPAGTFKNNFGITTSDWAYLRLSIVELHLGDGMRYKVMIDSVNVNHTIFNDRMVPIFSTVRLSCRRLLDYPSQNLSVTQPGRTS